MSLESVRCLDFLQMTMYPLNNALFLSPKWGLSMMDHTWTPLLCIVIPRRMRHFVFWPTCFASNCELPYRLCLSAEKPGGTLLKASSGPDVLVAHPGVEDSFALANKFFQYKASTDTSSWRSEIQTWAREHGIGQSCRAQTTQWTPGELARGGAPANICTGSN